MSSKLKLILSFFFVGLPSITFADDIRLSESYGGDCPVCEEQNRPVIDVEEINAKFEIFTDENNYQWCEEQQRYFVWGKCSGPVLESGVKTKNAIYKHTGQVYNSELNSLVYEGTCEGTYEQPEIKNTGFCEAKVTTDSDGNIQSVECAPGTTPTPPCAGKPNFDKLGEDCVVTTEQCDATSNGVYVCRNDEVVCSGTKPDCYSCVGKQNYDKIGEACVVTTDKCDATSDGVYACKNGQVVCDGSEPVCSACAGKPNYDKIGTACSVTNDECGQTNSGSYVCENGSVVCDAVMPNCLVPCDEMDVPTQGVQYQGSSREYKFQTAKGFLSNVQIGYTCVKTNAQYAKVGELDAGMFGWHNTLYDNNYAQMVTAGVTGGKAPTRWDDDRTLYKQNRQAAQEAYNSGVACYVCGSMRINGCFAPETKLTLADGSVKQAKEVKAGDELFNPLTKKAVTVERVIEGPEDVGMVSVKTASGELKVSQEHPMLTAKGLVQAKDLKAGDTVFNGDNQEVEVASVEIKPVEEGQYVINFIVKGDGDAKDYKNRMLLSEGVITGDLTTQIELKLGK